MTQQQMYFRGAAFDTNHHTANMHNTNNPYGNPYNQQQQGYSGYATPSYNENAQQQQQQYMGGQRAHRSHGGTTPFDHLDFYFSPKQRLNTLLTVHAFFSVLIGAIGYLFPRMASIFYSTESKREVYVARSILRLYCSLILAQGLVTWRVRKVMDGEIKRAMVQSYFVCFLLSTLALIFEHAMNTGVVSGKFWGIMKILTMIFLTCGYGWFTFFQPPMVWSNLGVSSKGF